MNLARTIFDLVRNERLLGNFIVAEVRISDTQQTRKKRAGLVH